VHDRYGKWRVRYAEQRLAGLDETGDRGAEPKYTATTDKRILALLDQPPPKGYARWSGPLLAAALGDVDVQYASPMPGISVRVPAAITRSSGWERAPRLSAARR
jgi:Homeodomain-like domain